MVPMAGTPDAFPGLKKAMHGCTEAAHTELCELAWVPGWSFIAERLLTRHRHRAGQPQKGGRRILRRCSSKPNNPFFPPSFFFNYYYLCVSIPVDFKCEHSPGPFNTHKEQGSAGAGEHKVKQPRHQPRKEGLLPKDQQLLIRPQKGSASVRSRQVAGEVRPALPSATPWQWGRVDHRLW